MEAWRLIKDNDLEGPENMARDEAILRVLEGGISSAPVLRIYGWKTPTVSLGYLQGSGPFEPSGLPIVRRITGGRAVLHDAEITYSVVAPIEHPQFREGILKTYSAISGCIIRALKVAGLSVEFSKGFSRRSSQKDACFHTPSRFEVLASGKKLVGSSQRRFKRAFLQHGSILFRIDERLNERVFGIDVIKRMVSVSEITSITRDEFSRLLVEGFASGLGADFTESGLTVHEREIKEGLLLSKYSKDEWNLSSGVPIGA